MNLPTPIHVRLDELARLADPANTSRAEIVAMLIAEADLDADSLVDRLLAYRARTVGEVVPAVTGDQAAIELRGAGRPRRAAGSGPAA